VPQVAPGVRAGGPAAKGAVPPPLPHAQPEVSEERAELERRLAVLDQLDYFEVMGLEPTASPADIKRAFHHQSRTCHPDRFFQSTDLELRDHVHAVYKRVTEAYFVLRDDSRRRQYLADISGPERLGKLRFTELAEAEAKAQVKKEVAEQIGTHPKGRQFFQAGLADLEAGRLAAAERNIKLALTYEPTNPLYLQKLEEARAKSYEEYKRSGRGFRIE
jgi:curved DNA-binding protein CbpA